MATQSIARKKRKRKKNSISTTHIPLCGLAPVIGQKNLFAPIHQLVKIDQKSVDYRPTDKLVLGVVGILSGAKAVYDINTTLRPNRPLLAAFGYDKCADQSVIAATLNAADSSNSLQLQTAIDQIFRTNSLCQMRIESQSSSQSPVSMDLDLSSLPASKAAQKSKKGYVANGRNQYGRQLGRIICSETQEIVTQSLYSGNTVSCAVFKEMVTKMEQTLALTTDDQRRRIRLRIDAGFSTDKNINFALWKGYKILAKMYSTRRATKLAQSVTQWEAVPSAAGQTKREAGWVEKTHRYGRKTVQVAVRTRNKNGQYSYSVLVSTATQATLEEIVTDYDGRSGVGESSFCQDYQGLGLRKRRTGGFIAQTILVLLSQLAHNLIIWIKSWLSDALAQSIGQGEQDPKPVTRKSVVLAQKTITQAGQKRFVDKILSVNGKVIFRGHKVVGLVLNPFYSQINRIATALRAFLKPYHIRVLLDEI